MVTVLVGLYFGFGGPVAAIATLAAGMVLTLVGDYVLELEAPYLAAVVGPALVYLIVAAIEPRRSSAA